MSLLFLIVYDGAKNTGEDPGIWNYQLCNLRGEIHRVFQVIEQHHWVDDVFGITFQFAISVEIVNLRITESWVYSFYFSLWVFTQKICVIVQHFPGAGIGRRYDFF